MLVLTRKNGESILIGDNIEITILNLGKGKVQVGIDAPKDINIVRKEVIEEVEDTNKQSVAKQKYNIGALSDIIKKKSESEKQK